METHAMNRIAAAAFALAAIPAIAAIAPEDSRRLSSKYSEWAGGKTNVDNIVTGLQNGSSVMLMTQGSDNTRSLAGFTPPAALSAEEVEVALAKARSTLASMGIRRPSADQIQAALIGGEVTLADGRTRAVQGSVTALPDTVATR
jgi:hypothetical protein